MNVEYAFGHRFSDIPVTLEGKVIKILPDDHLPIHHQRFIVQTSAETQSKHSGHTVLIAHNLERAYRVPMAIGDRVEVHGTYVWNKYGGIIHNTHHDHRSGHEDGWINFVGKKNPDEENAEKDRAS